MPVPNTLKANQGLFAEVNQVLTVTDNDQLRVSLEIEAQNRTKRTIFLDENYFIPVSRASNLEAYDVNNKEALTVIHDKKNDRLGVVFSPGTSLPPNKKFTWRVAFTTRFVIIETKEGGATGIFTLEPGQEYKQVPIKNHRIQLQVNFERGAKFREVSVSQSNTREVGVQLIEKPEQVEYIYEPFDLPEGNDIKFAFSYHYNPKDPDDPDGGGIDRKRWRDYAKKVCSGVWGFIKPVGTRVLTDYILGLFRRGGAS